MRALLPTLMAIALSAGPARAQLIVHDVTSYGSLIRQAQTAIDQLNELKAQVSEARRLFDGFNVASEVSRLAPTLAAPELRAILPETDRYVAAARGDLTALGELGRRAADIRAAQRLYTAATDDALGQDLERAGDRAARDLAVGEAVASAGAERLRGLQELTSALDAAPSARAAMDLQARLTGEQAMIANDQMRLQGLAMAQDAEDRLQAQRDRERAQAARDRRIIGYRRGFP